MLATRCTVALWTGTRAPTAVRRLVALFAALLLITVALTGCGVASAPSPVPTPVATVDLSTVTATQIQTPLPTAPTPQPAAPTPPATPTIRPPDTPTPRPTGSASATGSGLPTATPTRNIVVNAPTAGQTVRSPIRIAGVARVFEASVAYEVTSGAQTLAGGFTTASAGAPEWGTFAVDVVVPPGTLATSATVRVFSRSMRDGSVQDLVEVPVFLTAGSSTPAASSSATAATTRRITIYLVRKVDPGEIYVAVSREVPATPAIGRAAIEALLRGPTPEERDQGLESPVPAGTALLGLRIDQAVAYADFNRALLAHSGGPAREKSIARVISLTLEQFPTVREVVISVEGRTQGITQP